MAVTPVPEGYHTVTPYIVAKDAAGVIDFARRAFGAKEHHVMRLPDGRVMHGDIVIGSSHVMVGQAGGENKAFPAMLYLYVPDVDAVYTQALAAGGTSISEPATQFYGDRHGAVNDADGNQWWIATHVEDVPDDEMRRRAEQFMQQRSATA